MNLGQLCLRSASFDRKVVSGWWLVVSCLASAGCSKHLPLAAPAAKLSPPTRLCAIGDEASACRSARQLDELLAGPLTLLGMTDPPSGSQGAKLLTVRG